MCNIHAERESFFDTLWWFTFPDVDTFVVGDFNWVPDIQLDKWGDDDSFGDRAVTQLLVFTESLNSDDFYCVKFTTGRSFTWFNHAHSAGCQLDWFYTRKAWRSRITNFKCNSFGYSYHHLISLKFTLGNLNPRGQGVWKFNTAVKIRIFLLSCKCFLACLERKQANFHQSSDMVGRR